MTPSNYKEAYKLINPDFLMMNGVECKMPPVLEGFSDCSPSENISRNEVPGLSVAVIVIKANAEVYESIPSKQYKNCNLRQKIKNANKLILWLRNNQEKNNFSGFINTNSFEAASNIGLSLMEELPGASLTKVNDKYTLVYECGTIDFAHAVALQYYMLTISLGIMRAGIGLKPATRVKIYMDRFPGCESTLENNVTDGEVFIRYIRDNTKTGKDVQVADEETGFTSEITTLKEWIKDGVTKKAKTHPGFILPDWICAAALAKKYPGEFSTRQSDPKKGQELTSVMCALYDIFKEYKIMSLEDSVLCHLRASETHWKIDEDAKEYIFKRAGLCN
ncbi:MAG: hypothetical protein ACI9SC_001638 [Gammaproteobacteria bacterium]|jgi:hypothetical protein